MKYIKHLLILASTFTIYASISTFASLFHVHVEITSSAVGLKNCVITTGIKKFKLIIKKKRKKEDKIVFLAKSKLNKIDFLISKSLIDSYFSDNEFISKK